jgi:hypothetical protein
VHPNALNPLGVSREMEYSRFRPSPRTRHTSAGDLRGDCVPVAVDCGLRWLVLHLEGSTRVTALEPGGCGPFAVSFRVSCGPFAVPRPTNSREHERIPSREAQRLRGFSPIFAAVRGSVWKSGRTVQIGLFMRFSRLLRSLCGPKSRAVLAGQSASGLYGGATPHPHRGTGACATVSAPG